MRYRIKFIVFTINQLELSDQLTHFIESGGLSEKEKWQRWKDRKQKAKSWRENRWFCNISETEGQVLKTAGKEDIS